MADTPEATKGQQGIGHAALFGLCPKCGAKTLFGRLTAFAPTCRACGLDFQKFNVGDGPAAFLILIIGALVTGLAIWLELSFDPPWWLHVMLWAPLTVAGTIWGLRVAKAALLYSEYHRGGEQR
ncbi:DUF983 domain-containing protein [Altererythrobacter salegens]|uniref:DUF983 domain-containing protein n=1 Tax=Croceibacterium salegens TaxID=1737568 RepID=A0A6I4T0V1_9SPHN|nr:DUF983 domain-containing protein [Croceibacterium salegens]MXO60282.1 DUF983 domain-containing protein [Croceibacterium salegens]